jgi:hypothetical protein
MGGPDMAPHTPRSSRPGEAGALLERRPPRTQQLLDAGSPGRYTGMVPALYVMPGGSFNLVYTTGAAVRVVCKPLREGDA